MLLTEFKIRKVNFLLFSIISNLEQMDGQTPRKVLGDINSPEKAFAISSPETVPGTSHSLAETPDIVLSKSRCQNKKLFQSPFQCGTCFKEFSKNSNLTRHIKEKKCTLKLHTTPEISQSTSSLSHEQLVSQAGLLSDKLREANYMIACEQKKLRYANKTVAELRNHLVESQHKFAELKKNVAKVKNMHKKYPCAVK